MGAYRDIAVMGPEIKKQKELLEEFARNHANLELECVKRVREKETERELKRDGERER